MKIRKLIVLLIGALLVMVSVVSSEDVPFLLEKTVVLISYSEPGLTHALGTGFLVSADGLVLTADHVIADETNGDTVYPKLFAQRYTGTGTAFESYELSVVKRLRTAGKGPDIAVLRITRVPRNPLPFLQIGQAPSAGAQILVAGFPLVFDKVYPYPLFRQGTIASTRYNYEDTPVIVLDLTGVSGYSGSPVVDCVTGAVVAVFKGKPTAHPETNFSVAFTLNRRDVTDYDKSPSNQPLHIEPALPNR